MAEETPSAEGAPEEESPKPSTPQEPGGPGRGARVLSWLVLVFLGLFVCAQVAGVLLRDSLERRRQLLAHAPAPQPPNAGKVATALPAGPEASRFGPEIQEVVVGRAGSGAPASQPGAEPSPAPPVKAPATPPAPVATAPQMAPARPVSPQPTPKEAPPAERPKPAKLAQEAAPAESRRVQEKGTRVLLVDVFLSQTYLRESEQRLKKLGFPSMHTEFSRRGSGFKVQVSGANEAEREKARKTMESNGYLHHADAEGVEAYFFYRRETQALVDALAKQGLKATVAAVEGDRPYWRLYAGPFSEEDAKKAQQRLTAAGVKTTAEVRP